MAGISLSLPLVVRGSVCRPCLLHSSFVTNFPRNRNNNYYNRKFGSVFTSRRAGVKVQFSLQQVPDPGIVDAYVDDIQGLVSRAEGLLYTLADAAVTTSDSTAGTGTAAVQKNGGWFGFVADGLEGFLKVLKDGLTSVHVPYAYGFAIILLTVLVKIATFPLTKKQVESTLAMQNLQPKIKAIRDRYEGDQERIQLETARLYKQAGVNPLAGCLPTLATMPVWIGLYQALSNVANEGLLTEGFFWIPSLAGPTTIAARQNGTAISWLFPFVDGHPPLGWSDTFAYLVLPVLLVASQYVSMQIMQTPQADDPSQKNTQILLKFLPLMIGYFSLSVPSGLSIYWFTNNILSTTQQVWLRKLGGAKPVVDEGGSGIITAGRAKRSSSKAMPDLKEARRGERFRQKKAEEARRKADEQQEMIAAVKGQNVYQTVGSSSGSDDDYEDKDDQKSSSSVEKEPLEQVYAARVNGTTANNPAPKRSKRSKRKRAT
uniref:TSA: Wollemia nobilis Ref_Wollemi_Transcript_13121_1900 transcribed RNA sequence n=1 Tax=Wollemia nobilis TaxID=56998 RepID=A0A0C9RKW1_9CONI